jgi:prepilin-type N-terminal cleavage/methylation domain-containing protein
MRRHAFTIIELIFVIFILGVLTATAIAKMGGMADHAKEIQLKAFNGTLNRTSGGGFWSRSMEDDRNGSVAYADYDAEIDQYIDLVPGFTSGPSLVNCNADGSGTFLSYLFSVHYEIHCKDGNRHESPRFRLYKVETGEYLD